MTTLEEFQGLRVYRVLKRIGEQPTREKERDILKRIAERNQIQIRIAVLAQGERTRVLRIGTDREPAHPPCVLGCTVWCRCFVAGTCRCPCDDGPGFPRVALCVGAGRVEDDELVQTTSHGVTACNY